MRIAQVIDKLTAGGAQKLLVTFAEQARERDVELTVVVLWSNPRPAIVNDLESLGATVKILPGRGVANLRRLLQMIRYFRAQRFDVICTHLFHSDILGAITGLITRTPVITTLHNITMPDGAVRTFVWRNLVRRTAYCVVAVGQTVAAAHKNWLGSTRHEVLLNPVQSVRKHPPKQCTELRAALMGDPENTLILAVGMVAPQKAYTDLVEACSTICQPGSRNFVAIAGDGKLKDLTLLNEKIDELGLRDRVRVLGVRDDVPLLLSAADLFVLSSHWEGLPVAVLEAMSAGLPVVATRVGDVEHIIVDGVGVLVPPGQPTELRAAIVKMLDDPGQRQRCGRAAQEYVVRHHDPAIWLSRQLELFSEAIATRTQYARSD